MDALSLVAVKAFQEASFSLQTIKEHLEKPIFHLYLGRKSCPLAAPMTPQLISEKNNFLEAFQAYRHKPFLPQYTDHENDSGIFSRDAYWIGVENDRHYYWEGEATDLSDTIEMSRMQTRIRHDQPLSRSRWQFSPRQEHYIHFPGGE